MIANDWSNKLSLKPFLIESVVMLIESEVKGMF
jgi:hypothetical protein